MQAALTVEVKEWQDLLRTDSTRKLYRMALEMFCKQVKKTPDELIKLDKSELTKLVKSYVIQLKSIAVNTAGKPKEGQISVNSIPYYMAGIKSFLDFHEIELAWKSIKKYYPETVNHNLRAYTLEELRRLLALADKREAVILLLMVSSGCRVGAIPSLKWKHLERLPEGIAKLHVYADSKRDCYWTLISPECVAAIDRYMAHRKEQLGETIKPESYLVRDAYKIRPVLVGTIRKTIWELFKKTGLPTDELQPDHSCRKYFNTICMNAGVIHTWKELFMGHSLKLDDVYFDANSKESWAIAIEQYKKAVTELTVSEEARRALSNEIKLKNVPEIEKMKAQLEEVEGKYNRRTSLVEIYERKILEYDAKFAEFEKRLAAKL
jgi:integrase